MPEVHSPFLTPWLTLFPRLQSPPQSTQSPTVLAIGDPRPTVLAIGDTELAIEPTVLAIAQREHLPKHYVTHKLPIESPYANRELQITHQESCLY